MTLYKSRLYQSIITIAQLIAETADTIRARGADLVRIAEEYETERRLCLRCGAWLDEDGRCPQCFERDQVEGRGDE